MVQPNPELVKNCKKTDAQLQREVLEELQREVCVQAEHVGVEVQDGMAVLTGHVDSYAERLAAQDAAHRVGGLLDVVNDILVKIPGSFRRDDVDLLRDVRRALDADFRLPHEKIRTTVSDGVVTLEGTVETWTQHEDAACALRDVSGIRHVKNLITVEPPAVALQSLRGAVDSALARQAASVADQVHIAVNGANVTLKGRVPSASERRVVEEAVRRSPGVKAVENQLEVQSESLS